jgi:hypothetical protein
MLIAWVIEHQLGQLNTNDPSWVSQQFHDFLTKTEMPPALL